MTISIHFVPPAIRGAEPWVVKDGRKVIGSHFTLEAALYTFECAIQRAGHRAVDETLTASLRDLRSRVRDLKNV